jgi:ribokinase
MRKICVAGSLNMDLVVTVARFPQPGETLVGKDFETFPGGKGANQAVAAGRLESGVQMIGKIGDDTFGERLNNTLQDNGVITDGLAVESGTSSGIAVIEVDGLGENHIIIVPGANGKVDQKFMESRMNMMLGSDIFLLQLEIPLATVVYLAGKLREYGKTVILDPAPARILPDEILAHVDYLTPNENEIALLTERSVENESDLDAAARELLDRGVGCVILKAGKKGAYVIQKGQPLTHVPSFKVNPVDTTGAGDSFNAGFAVSLARGRGLIESVKYANAVGALSTTAKGAQNAMPTDAQVRKFLKLQGSEY